MALDVNALHELDSPSLGVRARGARRSECAANDEEIRKANIVSPLSYEDSWWSLLFFFYNYSERYV